MNYLRGALSAVSAASQYYRDINPSTLTGAIDVIVIRKTNDNGEEDLACSPFHVRFGKWQVLRPVDKKVKVLVNGQEIPFKMKIGDAGEAFFVFETDNDVPEDLITSPILEATQPGQSNIEVSSGRFGARETVDEHGDVPMPSEKPLGEPEPLDLDSPSVDMSGTTQRSGLTMSRPSSSHVEASSSSPSPPSTVTGMLNPSNILGHTANAGKAVVRAVVESEHERRVRDEVNAARNIAAHTYESAGEGLARVRNSRDGKGDEVLPQLTEGEGEPPAIVYSNDMVLDTAGYHSKGEPLEGVKKSTRRRVEKRNSRETIVEEPDDYDSYEGPSTPRSDDPSNQDTPTRTPDTSRSPSPDGHYDTTSAKHSRSHTVAGFRASSEPPDIDHNPGDSLPAYSWEWGAFPTPSPMKATFSPPRGETLEMQRSVSVPPERELDANTQLPVSPSRGKTHGAYPSPPSTPTISESGLPEMDEGAELTADEHNGRRFLLTLSGRTQEFALSICVLSGATDEIIDARRFKEGQISFRRFMKFPAVVHDKNLVIKWNDRYITRQDGSYLMDSLVKWREAALAKPTNARALEEEEPLSSSDEYEPDTTHERSAPKKTSSWVRWWRSSRTDPEPEPQPQPQTSPSAPLLAPGRKRDGQVNSHRPGLVPSISAPVDANERATTPVPFPSMGSPQKDEAIAADARSEFSSESQKRFAKTLRLTSEQLKELNLKAGLNSITFSLSASGATACTASIFLWESTDSIVVSDIDGTITKSDALGHVFTMIGRDWTHLGVAKLYTDICRNGYRIMYLTSRAIGQADSTRYYLKGVKQNNYQLPEGPVIMSPDRLMASFHREVIMRKPEVFKMACLRDIQRLFGEQGNPFYAGFGNRITDALSYRSVNILRQRIFTIDSSGEVKMELLEVAGYKSSYIHLTDLVDQMFPPIHQKRVPEFTDFNFWKTPLQEFELPNLSPPSPTLSATSDTSGQSTLTRIRNFSLRQSSRPLLPLPVTQGDSWGNGGLPDRLGTRHVRSTESLRDSATDVRSEEDIERERRAWKRMSIDSMPGSLSGSQADLEDEENEEEDGKELGYEGYEERGDDQYGKEYEGEAEDPEEAAEEGFDDDLLATGEMESVPFL